MHRAAIRHAILLPLAMVAGCGADEAPTNAGNDFGAQLARDNATDPAVVSALQDQIMVDPSLTSQANGDAVRPPDRPYSAAAPAPGIAAGSAAGDEAVDTAPAPGACPSCRTGREALTLGELAAAQRGGNRQCVARLGYSALWANRLPAAFALHPDARVTEAAGTDAAGCRLRVVSFTLARPVGATVDWLYARAKQGGYSADHQADGDQHVLGGTRGDAAYAAFLSPTNGGTAVDLIVDGG